MIFANRETGAKGEKGKINTRTCTERYMEMG